MKALSNFFTALVQRFLPDPFVFALILTLILFVSGIVFTPHGPIEMVQFWGSGFWNLLAFAMQMSLVLVTGHALASSPLVKKRLVRFDSSCRCYTWKPNGKNGWTYSAVRHDFYRLQLIYYPRIINCPSYYDKTDDADGKRSGRN